MEVAELFAALGFKIDRASWDRANSAIQSVGKMLGSVVEKTRQWGQSLAGQATQLAAGYGFGKLITTGLKFNSTVEEARNQIAGMLALSKKTDLSDQLGVANDLMASLQARAAKLPGTTAEYVQMLSMLTQPVSDAGLGLKDLEDITVNSVVGAKALGVEWSAAARDVDQALRGTFHSNDVFTGKILGSIGYKGEEGRQRFNAMTAKQRADVLKKALTQKQLDQLAAAQGQTASGKLSTLVDTAQQTLGRVMAPLFAKLVGYLEQVNQWLDKNSDKVKAIASDIGGVLVKALAYVVEAVQFLIEHPNLAIGLGAVLAVLMLIASPVALVVAGVVLLIVLIKRLGPLFEAVGHAMKRVFEWLKTAFRAIADGVAAVGKAIAAPFIAAADLIKSVFTSVYDWVAAKYEWIADKLDWVANKADKIRNFLGLGPDTSGDGQLRTLGDSVRNAPGVTSPSAPSAPRGLGWLPSIPMPSNATTNNNVTQNISPTFNVSSTDPQTAADMVDEKMRQMWGDAHDSLRGGKR